MGINSNNEFYKNPLNLNKVYYSSKPIFVSYFKTNFSTDNQDGVSVTSIACGDNFSICLTN